MVGLALPRLAPPRPALPQLALPCPALPRFALPSMPHLALPRRATSVSGNALISPGAAQTDPTIPGPHQSTILIHESSIGLLTIAKKMTGKFVRVIFYA